MLKCSRHQGEYIRSFCTPPIAERDQRNSGGNLFEFFLHPTYDFMQEILSYGKEVTVLEPKILVDEIRAHLQSSLNNYSEDY